MSHPLVLIYLAEAQLEQARREARYPAPHRGWKLFRRAPRPGRITPVVPERSTNSESDEERVPALV